jgi:hypothetical protein
MQNSTASNDHPSNLGEFIAGKLSPSERDTVLAHITNCDVCWAQVEHAWQATDLAGKLSGVPTQSPNFQRLQLRLAHKINRNDLGVSVVRFFSSGFAQVFLTFLKPFFAHSKSNPNPPTGTPDARSRNS